MRRCGLVLLGIATAFVAYSNAKAGTEMVRFGELLAGVSEQLALTPERIPSVGWSPHLLRGVPNLERTEWIPQTRELLFFLKAQGAFGPINTKAYLAVLPRPTVIQLARDSGVLTKVSDHEKVLILDTIRANPVRVAERLISVGWLGRSSGKNRTLDGTGHRWSRTFRDEILMNHMVSPQLRMTQEEIDRHGGMQLTEQLPPILRALYGHDLPVSPGPTRFYVAEGRNPTRLVMLARQTQEFFDALSPGACLDLLEIISTDWPLTSDEIQAGIVLARELKIQMVQAPSERLRQGIVAFNLRHLERVLSPYAEWRRQGFVPRKGVKLNEKTSRELGEALAYLYERASSLGINESSRWQPTFTGYDNEVLSTQTIRMYESAPLRQTINNLLNFMKQLDTHRAVGRLSEFSRR